jgi:ABC-type arginine/histidine transport system permease subunit
MCNSALKDVSQAQVVALGVNGMDIIGDVLNGEVLQVDRGRHNGIFALRFARKRDLTGVCLMMSRDQKLGGL